MTSILSLFEPLLKSLSNDPVVALSVLVAVVFGLALWSQSKAHALTVKAKDERHETLRKDMQKSLDEANDQLSKLNESWAEANKAGSENLNLMAAALARVANTLSGLDSGIAPKGPMQIER